MVIYLIYLSVADAACAQLWAAVVLRCEVVDDDDDAVNGVGWWLY